MMNATSARVKLQAAEWVPANRDEVDAAIAQIGAAQRQRAAIQTKLNDRLARLKEAAEHDAAPHADSIKMLSRGIQAWADANRGDLCKGAAKTVKLGNGELCWRARPPSVVVRGVDAVIAALRKLKLDRFLRQKTEIDKSAILRDPTAVDGVKGITVSSTGEDFVITPFATELEEVA